VNFGVETIRRLKENAFFRHNAVFFLGSVAVGALNYLYYPILGRLLPPAAFGEVQTLVSFFLQLSIFLSVLGLVTVNVSANYDNPQNRNRVVFELERFALVVSLLLLGLSVMFGGQLQQFFRFDDPLPFVVLMLAIVVSVPFTFRGAFVRGRHGFGVASTSNLIASAAKIALSVALVVAGLGTAGAIWGVAAAQFVAFIYIAYWARRMGLSRADGVKWTTKPDMTLLVPELKYASMVLVTSLLITLQFSIDILIVKHYFDAQTAGQYAGVATVARIIFFLTGSISQVLMPMVRLKNSAAENSSLLKRSFMLLGVTGLPALLLFVLAPGPIMRVLMGAQYVEYANLLPVLSAAIFTVAITNLVVSYYMALRRYLIALVVTIGAAVTYVLMITHHSTLRGVIESLLIGSLSMIALVAGLAVGRNWVNNRGKRLS
jgi:O-antigen/teichoic acid export membrane protein